jgi:hypothetical protein
VHIAPQRLRWVLQNFVGAWMHHSPMLALVHHRSISTAPEFLQMVAHIGAPSSWAAKEPSSIIFPLLFFFAGTRSPSSNQSSFPSRKSLSLASGRGKFTLTNLKSPISSPLIYFSCFKYSNPREVPTRRCSGFLEFPVSKK